MEERKAKAVARIIHEANKGLCESVRDFSQKPWSEAPAYNHTSAMAPVLALAKNPNLTPEDIHNVWVDNKKADGWVYGPTKDWEKKTHPSMVPYDKLSAFEQYKDHLVREIALSYINFPKNDTYSYTGET